MTDSIWDIIADTPWWVYVLIVAFVRISWFATKPQCVSAVKLFFFPIILLSLIAAILMLTLPLQNTDIGLFTLGLLLGSCIGWLQFRLCKIKAIRGKQMLYIPGSWLLFIAIILLIVGRFYVGIHWQVTAEILPQSKLITIFSALYGLSLGLLLGRLFYAVRCLKHGPFYAEDINAATCAGTHSARADK